MAERGVNPAIEREIAEFIITREFSASRDRMWTVWTECAHLMKWWGPKGFAMRTCKIDLRSGGFFHYCLHGPDGADMWGKFEFREIVKPERLVYLNSFSDESGGVARHPLHETWPLRMLTTILFSESAGRTTVTVRWIPYEATESERDTFDKGRDSMKQGWTGTFDQLASHLAVG